MNILRKFSLVFSIVIYFLFSNHCLAAEQETQQAKDLVKMISSMVGHWVGDVQYYDKKTGEMKRATADHTISTTPISTVFTILGTFYPKEGKPRTRYEIMGVRGDGAILRMMDYKEFSDSIKSEIVLDYNIKNDNDWTMTFLEEVESHDGDWTGPELRKVHFHFTGDAFTIKKTSILPTDREFDLYADVKRQ